MADDDWDLYAVVRGGCRSTTTTTTTALETSSTILATRTSTSFSSTTTTLPLKEEEEENDDPLLLFSSSLPNNLIQPNGFQELHQLFMPFIPNNTSTTTSGCNRSIYPNSSSSPFPDISGAIGSINTIMPEANSSTFGYEEKIFPDQLVQQNQQLQIVQQQKFQDDRQIISSNNNNNNSAMSFPNMQAAQTPTRSRKRKSQQKRMVCHVTAENLSSDLWAWRKYGQKPIKGSPFPRNYYRCSSSKGCGARKQVEKSNTEPDMFIVTYTGDHTHPRPTHRNSLAGSTRNNKPSAVARQPGSPTTPLTAATAAEESADDPILNNNNNNNNNGIMDMGSDEDDDEEILIPNMAVMIENSVFLEGANQIDGPANPVQLNQVSHLSRSSPG